MNSAVFQIWNGIRIAVIAIAVLIAVAMMSDESSRAIQVQLACIALIVALKSAK